MNTEQSEASMTSVQRRHLSDKLHDLQDKKHYMDDLLQELHTLRHHRYSHLNNGVYNLTYYYETLERAIYGWMSYVGFLVAGLVSKFHVNVLCILFVVTVAEIDAQSITSSQGHILESITATASANKTASEAEDVLEMLKSRKKLK